MKSINFRNFFDFSFDFDTDFSVCNSPKKLNGD